MGKLIRAGAAILAAGLLVVFAWDARAQTAASDVGVGGYQDQAVEAVHRDLLAGAPEAPDTGFRIAIESGPTSALTEFTPRFGGLGGPAMGHPEALAESSFGAGGLGPDSNKRLQLGYNNSAEIAGVTVDLSANAAMVAPPSAAPSDVGSGLVVGGGLAVAGVRFDAAYGHDAASLIGLDGTRMTAGVAYGLGPVDARVSYSLVDSETAAGTSLFTLGSQLTLVPGLVVQGDLAYAEDGRQGDAKTAGRVGLKLNF
jgi:hypothetical protein